MCIIFGVFYNDIKVSLYLVTFFLVQYTIKEETRVAEIIEKFEVAGGWDITETGYPKGFDTEKSAIVLVEIKTDKYEVIDGSHRIQAFSQKGIKKIPHCVVLTETQYSIDHNFFICAILNRHDRQEEYQSEVYQRVGFTSHTR